MPVCQIFDSRTKKKSSKIIICKTIINSSRISSSPYPKCHLRRGHNQCRRQWSLNLILRKSGLGICSFALVLLLKITYIFEQLWAICSCCSRQKSDGSDSTFFTSKSLICSQKTSNLLEKPMSKFSQHLRKFSQKKMCKIQMQNSVQIQLHLQISWGALGSLCNIVIYKSPGT